MEIDNWELKYHLPKIILQQQLISIPKKNVSGFINECNKSSLYNAVEIGYFTNLNENKFLIIE